MNTSQGKERLLELLADEQFAPLTPEEQAELDALSAQAGGAEDLSPLVADLLVGLDRRSGDREELDPALRARLLDVGQRVVAPPASLPMPRSSGLRWGLAAALFLALGGLVATLALLNRSDQALDNARTELAQIEAEMQERVESNAQLVAAAEQRANELQAEIERRSGVISEQEQRLADAARRETDMASRLASATQSLDRAQATIARYEAPVDPATLAANRRQLLEVPDTIRIAWQPFDLPDAPAEQQDVTGDVVWNDELQTGYLRFVGLDVNNPLLEQYQVWVIDDRGLEQKVSGGVFDATLDGEVIVPIEPGIDVRRVALFAITVEEPGGTWVPDLRRRVTVAPRDAQ